MNMPTQVLPDRLHDTTNSLILIAEAKLIQFLQPYKASPTQDVPASARAAAYHMASGGQRIRLRLALHACVALKLGSDDALAIASCAELLHNASLIHDDLQDRDEFRRGRKSVWAAFGDDTAICSGDLLLSSAYAALATFSQPTLLPMLFALTHSRTAQAIAGQCADLAATGLLSTAAYEDIAIAKSGALLSLPVELALVASGNSIWQPQARLAANSFSIGYQIIDDIADIERDTNRGGPAAALNILLVLHLPGRSEAEALAKARTIALNHLSAAALAAEQLPMRSGSLLRESALRLSVRL